MARVRFIRSIDTTERAYEAWRDGYGYVGIVYRARRGWRATATPGTYPTRAAAAAAAYAEAAAYPIAEQEADAYRRATGDA